MSAYYDLFEKPDVRQTGEQQSLYARFVPKGTIDRKEFIERVHLFTGLSRSLLEGAMAGYIEYKNKTQEKCNYCTIYQCISGFYKKNVELHLLLILAIDSLIYSFYVTILLCKKAPVFD